MRPGVDDDFIQREFDGKRLQLGRHLCSRADKLTHQLEAAMKVATVGNKQAVALASAIALGKSAPSIPAKDAA